MRALGPWVRGAASRVFTGRVFGVEAVQFTAPDGDGPHQFHLILSQDWINVVPLVAPDRVLLLRQYRFGVEGFTLETPGGVCDPGEDPAATARRELREETGYDAGEIVELGSLHPNPALQGNRCHCYLARGLVRAGEPIPDPHEAFEAVEVPLAEIPERIRRGEITSSIVVAAFYLMRAQLAPDAGL